LDERDNLARLDVALAGMLGFQTWRAQPQTSMTPHRPRQPMPPAKAGSANTASGRWIHADAGQGRSGEILLDRRALPRTAASSGIASGTIEKVAGKWLDGALGMNPSVEHADYHERDRTVSRRPAIDWDSGMKNDQPGTGRDPAAGKSDK
jgi:hypothetical protein